MCIINNRNIHSRREVSL